MPAYYWLLNDGHPRAGGVNHFLSVMGPAGNPIMRTSLARNEATAGRMSPCRTPRQPICKGTGKTNHSKFALYRESPLLLFISTNQVVNSLWVMCGRNLFPMLNPLG